MVYDLSAPGIIADYYLRMGSSMLFVSLRFVWLFFFILTQDFFLSKYVLWTF